MEAPAGLTPPFRYDPVPATVFDASGNYLCDMLYHVPDGECRASDIGAYIAAALNAYAAQGETTEDDVIGYRDKRPHRAGWARGPYQRICQECERVFVGDKRAVTCAPCAYRDAPAADIPLPHDDAQPAEPVKYGGTGIDELNRAAEATQPAPVVKESLTTEPAPEWSREPPTEAEATIRKFRTVRQEDSP